MSLRKRLEKLERTALRRREVSIADMNRGFDDHVAADEAPWWSARRGGPKSLAVLKAEHEFLEDAGLLDPDEPTPYSHALYTRQMRAEFTPIERQMIRAQLWGAPDA